MKNLRKFLASGAKLKSWFKQRSLKQRCLLGALVLASGLIIYCLMTLLFINQAKLSLTKLKISVETEKICHEACRLERLKQQEIVIKALQKGDQRLEKEMERYFFQASESREFKKELIKIWRQKSEPATLPENLEKYLQAANGDPELQALILKSFLTDANDPRVDYYFSILNGNSELALKKEAVRALSNIRAKQKYFTVDQLTKLNDLIFRAATPNKLRQFLVLLLNDYYQLFPTETKEILLAVYNNKNLQDNLSRAFSADILNRDSGRIKFPLPVVSAGEWDEYYNN